MLNGPLSGRQQGARLFRFDTAVRDAAFVDKTAGMLDNSLESQGFCENPPGMAKILRKDLAKRLNYRLNELAGAGDIAWAKFGELTT